MSGQWVGAVLGAAVGGAFGAFGTWMAYLTGAKTRASAEKIADSKNKHDRDLAVEQRQQQRRAEAYVEILAIAEQVGQWAGAVLPMLDEGQKTPDLPDLAQQARVNALISAYGSSKAIVFYEAWRSAAGEVQQAVLNFQAAERARSGSDAALEQRRNLDLSLREKERNARKALGDELAAELQGVRRGP
jgi:hypothetical protein